MLEYEIIDIVVNASLLCTVGMTKDNNSIKQKSIDHIVHLWSNLKIFAINGTDSESEEYTLTILILLIV